MGFFREVMSENGEPSSKRIIGGIAYFVCLFCVVVLVLKEGGTVVVESLLQTILVTSSYLLGISNITDIWKGEKKTRRKGAK